MFYPEVIKKIESVNRYTLRALHDVFGIDYNKPFFAASITGPVTVNKIEKLIISAGIDPRNAENVVLIDSGNKCRRRDWTCVTLDGRGGFDIEHRDNYWRNGSTRRAAGFDWYCRKSDFNEDRKRNTAEIIIISQHAEHLKTPAEKTLDPSERYKVIDTTKARRSASSAETYISRVNLQRTTDQGSTVEIGNTGRIIYRGEFEPRTLDEVIDKSGYLVMDRRKEWKRRARALKADRDRAAANAADYSGQLEQIEKMIDSRKREIIEHLKAAKSYREIEKVSKELSYFHGLADIVSDFERVKDAAETKKFSSPERARAAFDSLRARLDPANAGEEAKTA